MKQINIKIKFAFAILIDLAGWMFGRNTSKNKSKLPFLIGVLAIGMVALSGCGVFYKTYRYRLTVNVEVAGKVYSGSAVQEIQYNSCPPGFSAICASSSSSRGEAVVVDVGGRGYLFLLENLSLNGLAESNGYPGARKRFENNKAWEISDKWLSEFPFVTFSDVKNPRSVKEVYPRVINSEVELRDEEGQTIPGINGRPKLGVKTTNPNFQEIFGDDAKLVSVTVTPTRDPMTWGQVEKIIPWIRDDINSYKKTMRGLYFGYDVARYDIKTIYSNMDFSFFIRE